MMMMMNTTIVNQTEEGAANPRTFSYYSLFVTLFFILPIFVGNAILIVAIVTEAKIARAVRFVLANIIAASEVVILSITAIFLQNVILSSFPYLESSVTVCQLAFFLLSTGAAARLLYMAMFAVTVGVLVHRGTSKLKLLPFAVAGLLLWVIAIGPNLVMFSPLIWDITFHTDSVCFAYGVNTTTTILYTAAYIGVYGFGSFITGILLSILTICYIKRNTISDNTKTMQRMVKLSILLIIGNTVNFVGISLPMLFSTVTIKDPETFAHDLAISYLQGVLLLLSLLPTPVILLVFFKPLRQRLKAMICCVRAKTTKKGKLVLHKTKTNVTVAYV